MMNRRILAAALLLVTAAACTTFQVTIERTPTPDLDAVGTLSSLILEGTRTAARATELALPITPTPITGSVTGQVCYPSERIPPMTIYFWNTSNNDVIGVGIQSNQARYRADLEPGSYLAFAWAADYQVGGLYSNAILCGLQESCIDHSPAEFDVTAGSTTTGVDLCDWAYAAGDLPHPPDFVLPATGR